MDDIDLKEIKDLKELKALAYDELAKRELTERKLTAINQRIIEVTNEQLNGSGPGNKTDTGTVSQK